MWVVKQFIWGNYMRFTCFLILRASYEDRTGSSSREVNCASRRLVGDVSKVCMCKCPYSAIH